MPNQLPSRGPEGEHAPEFPLFFGVVEVLELIKKLYKRRRRAQRREFTEGSRSKRRGPKWLPLLCLVRPERQSALLPALSSWLNEADPHRVPHAYVELTPDRREPTREPKDTKPPRGPWGTRDVETIRDNLRNIANALADPRNGRTRHLRFPRFGHAHWLMKQELPDYEPSERRNQLRKELQKRSPDPLRFVDDAVPQANSPSWWWYVRTALNICLPPWFRLKAAGWVPWPGRVAWHFMHQPYLAPDDPGTFLGFAERLTDGEWQKESPEQLAKLLVGAFLEDLRAEYRGPYWSAGRRRTSYALVLLDNITRHNGGYTLQKAINNVRNDTGVHDPLLLITASAKVPPHAQEPSSGNIREVVFDATEADDGYDAWRNELTVKRRDRQDMAFYLPLSTFNEPDEDESPSLRRKLRARKPVLDRPPWWSRRALWFALAVVALGGLGYGWYSYNQSHCQAFLSWPDPNPTLSWENGQCIGVTDGSYDFFTGHTFQPGAISTKVARLNEDAITKYGENPERGIVTISYVGAFSSEPNSADAASQRETMVGIALAQKKNNEHIKSAPVVRVLITNAGKDMASGETAASQLRALKPESHLVGDDSSLVGAVGFDHSSRETTKTIGLLNNAGIPTVAAPLSSNELADSAEHPFYRSIAPTNAREAQIAAHFAKEELWNSTDRTVHIFHPIPSDEYSRELSGSVKTEAEKVGLPTEDHPFSTDPAHRRAVSEELCGSAGLVYFAGRGNQFESTVEGFLDPGSKCGDPPAVLASDDVSRLVADRMQDKPGDDDDTTRFPLPFSFESFAVAPTQDDPYADPYLTWTEKDVYSSLNAEFDRESPRSVDGHAFLAYKATKQLLVTAETAADRCAELAAPHSKCFPLDPGAVLERFVQDPPKLDRPISIVRVGNGQANGKPVVVGTCADPAESQQPRFDNCPPAHQ